MYHPEGVFPAMPVPFKKNGDLDEASLKELIKYFEGTGVNGLLIMGTAGEFAMLSEAERRKVIDIAVDTAKKLDLIVNTGYASTRETVTLTKYAKDAGADAAIVVEPYFYHPSPGGMAKHFLTVADRADFPVMAYNIPPFAGNFLTPDIMDEFAKDERIVGIKDSEGSPLKLLEFIARAPRNFSVMVGVDGLASYGIAMGAKGMMIGGASMAPGLCVEMYDSLKKGDHKKAFDLQNRFSSVIKAMMVGTFPAAIKYAMDVRKVPAGYVRAPLESLSGPQKKEVERYLRQAKVIK